MLLTDDAKKLKLAGADMILICTNTMHKVFKQVQSAVSVPLIHIAEATAGALEEEHIRSVALLGIKYTMTQDFYKEKLTDRGFKVLVPHEEDIELVNGVIFKGTGIFFPGGKR